jgi:hypothetical protein
MPVATAVTRQTMAMVAAPARIRCERSQRFRRTVHSGRSPCISEGPKNFRAAPLVGVVASQNRLTGCVIVQNGALAVERHSGRSRRLPVLALETFSTRVQESPHGLHSSAVSVGGPAGR